jgi:ubiquinone/menaquinone biosynthesis C-methylase UbiE
VVTANGVFNLAPEKERAAAEAWRVLKPGGRLVAAEIVLSGELPASERSTLDDWFR